MAATSTDAILGELETFAANELQSSDGSAWRATRASALLVHRKILDLFLLAPKDQALKAIYTAHRGGYTFAPKGADEDVMAAPLYSRYGINASADRMETLRWRGIMMIVAGQAAMARTLLTMGGHDKNNAAMTDKLIDFGIPIPAGTPNDRTQQRKDLANEWILPRLTSTRKAAGLGPIVVTTDQAADYLKPALSTVPLPGKVYPRFRTISEQGGTGRGAVMYTAFPLDKKDAAWPDSLTFDGKTFPLSSRDLVLIPRLNLDGFVGDSSMMPTTVPTRTIEMLLRDHPAHLPTTDLKWWH